MARGRKRCCGHVSWSFLSTQVMSFASLRGKKKTVPVALVARSEQREDDYQLTDRGRNLYGGVGRWCSAV